jgi:hypothetical protein
MCGQAKNHFVVLDEIVKTHSPLTVRDDDVQPKVELPRYQRTLPHTKGACLDHPITQP